MTTKELMMKRELQIIADMKNLLLNHTAEENLRWKSTKTDLIQMVHILYESEEVRDDEGLAVTFKELVERFCMLLHVAVPNNPYAYVRRGDICQGIRKQKLLIRYLNLYI